MYNKNISEEKTQKKQKEFENIRFHLIDEISMVG